MPSAPAAFLDPGLLARISDLELLARTVVDGFLHGVHRSVRKGSSLDFAEHRPYQPGDDLRRIDWRVYGRTDRFYLKEYDADTNASLLCVLDISASMDYGSADVTKFAYGRMLAASLAWMAQRQGDRVGLVTVADEVVEVIPPSARHLPLILHTLGRARCGEAGSVPDALTKVAHLAARPGVTAIITDCYEEPDALGRAADTLRARGHDVIVFHVMDVAERDLPDGISRTFEDAESGTLLPLRPDELRTQYQALMTAHQQALTRRLAASGAQYTVLTTNEPLDRALHAFLAMRTATSPRR